MNFKIGALLVTLSFITTSRAANFTVVTDADSGPGSLRQAILDANAGGGGKITFSNVGGLIILSNQLPTLTNEIQIVGPGPEHLSIEGHAIFTNAPNNLAVISGLQITNSANAIANLGTLILSNCTMVNGHSGSPDVPSYLAPGIYSAGELMASYCTLSGNYTFYYKDGTAIHNSGTMSLAFCTITNNNISFGVGAGIYNAGDLTADYCTIADNGQAGDSDGGGIHNDSGTVVLRNCSITNNVAVAGGGILNNAWMGITNCTLAQNHAGYSDGAQTGGGMMNHGYVALQNTTVSGNYCTPAGIGAGIWNDGVVVLVNSTIVSNHIGGFDCFDPSSGAGIWNSGVVRSRNSIIAGNLSSLPCAIQGPDFWGNLQSLGHNLIQNTSGWTNVGVGKSDLVGLAPMLGPLQDNGGPTWTHALLAGSPAIDAGDSSYLLPIDDQRGILRPQGVAVDIGAFEYQFTAPVFMRIGRDNLMLHFQASTPPLKTYIVQYSTNLSFWQDNFVLPLTATSNGVVDFYSSTVNPKLFFRLKSQ